LALGALQTPAFVHTAWWPLPLLSTALLVLQLRRATPGRAFVLGWAYGTGWLAAGVWWLFISMHRYGGLPAALSALAVLALALTLSLYLGLACALHARWRSGRPAADATLFAALWLLAEWARGVIFTGFPWLASGYAQVDAPLAALAPWIGVYGIGAVAAATAAALAEVLASRARHWHGAAVAAAALVLLGLAGGGRFTQPTGEFGVTLLQTQVRQDEKFAVERMPEVLAWVARAMVEAKTELVVAPETAVPLLPPQLRDFAPGYWEALRDVFAEPGRAALLGVPLGDYERGYTNSVVGWHAGTEYRYDKSHLVPFGEFIPYGFRWFTELMNIPLGDFARGARVPPSFAFGAQRLAPNICYEDLFGEELARRFADAAAAPTAFVNLSNIGWFGETIAVAQHLNISRMRALEFQRPMLRATNTGATAAIDHEGRVSAMLKPHTRGVLSARVQGRSGLTPYAWWSARLDLWPLGVLATALVILAARRRRARR
jgi:apolipoprotein N-acyltransferase